MQVITGVVLFVMIWWIIFFMTLPFGVKPSKKPEPGWETGAPQRTHLKMKVLITTIISFFSWYGVVELIKYIKNFNF
jgi:predicted secreted protein